MPLYPVNLLPFGPQEHPTTTTTTAQNNISSQNFCLSKFSKATGSQKYAFPVAHTRTKISSTNVPCHWTQASGGILPSVPAHATVGSQCGFQAAGMIVIWCWTKNSKVCTWFLFKKFVCIQRPQLFFFYYLREAQYICAWNARSCNKQWHQFVSWSAKSKPNWAGTVTISKFSLQYSRRSNFPKHSNLRGNSYRVR